MNPDVVSILRDPGTGEDLQLVTGRDGASLIAAKSGRQFPVRDGIPDFLDASDLSGPNGRYQRLYDRIASFYDASTWLYARIRSRGEEARRREYLNRLEIERGNRVLEVSVGTGANLPLLPAGASFFGLDISWGMLRRCRRRARRHKLGVELFLGAAERLPFRDAVFDSVLHVGGINFFTDRARAIGEMVRVAKPGTRIVIADEMEEFAAKHESTLVARAFYGKRAERIESPVALLPEGMLEVANDLVGGGDLYCLTFRTPRAVLHRR